MILRVKYYHGLQFSKEDPDQRRAKVSRKSGVEPSAHAAAPCPVARSLAAGGHERGGASRWERGAGAAGAGVGSELPRLRAAPTRLAGRSAAQALTRPFASLGARRGARTAPRSLRTSPVAPARGGERPRGAFLREPGAGGIIVEGR